jgi:hypothetical protein
MAGDGRRRGARRRRVRPRPAIAESQGWAADYWRSHHGGKGARVGMDGAAACSKMLLQHDATIAPLFQNDWTVPINVDRTTQIVLQSVQAEHRPEHVARSRDRRRSAGLAEP